MLNVPILFTTSPLRVTRSVPTITRSHCPCGHNARHHRIADDRHVDAGLQQFPGREPAALQQRPRFVRKHLKRDTRGVREV